MRKNVIIKTISRLSVPFIQVFALYVIVHGALGAGGGFQGGVVFAASFILMIIAFGLTCVRQRFSYRWIVALSALGITIYATIGLLCLIPGAATWGMVRSRRRSEFHTSMATSSTRSRSVSASP